MKKLLLFLGLMGISGYLMSATIIKPYTKSTGQTLPATEYNANLDIIYKDYNGNIDGSNIKNSAITGDKINNGTITPNKMDITGTYQSYNLQNTYGITSTTITVSTGTFTHIISTGTGTSLLVTSGTITNLYGTTVEGTWKRIEYQVLLATATSFTTTATMVGSTDLEYKFLVYGYGGSNSTIFLQINNVSGGNVYSYLGINSDGTSVTTSHTGASNDGIAIGSVLTKGMISIEGTCCRINNYVGGALGYWVYNGQSMYDNAGATFAISQRSGIAINGAAVTYFTIYGTTANCFGVGTTLEVWVRR